MALRLFGMKRSISGLLDGQSPLALGGAGNAAGTPPAETGPEAVARAVARAQAASAAQQASKGAPANLFGTASALRAPGAATVPVVEVFRSALARDADMAVAVAAIKALTWVIERSKASTMMGLEIELKEAAAALQRYNPSAITLMAGCELFMRYVMRTQVLESADLDTAKAFLMARGSQFAETSLKARARIGEIGERFIRDGGVVLVHGHSRVVLALLRVAAQQGKNFSVIVTEGRPDATGIQTAGVLQKMGIPVRLVLDSAAAFVMEDVDMVLVGAEGVMESGGVVNKLGTYQVALAAHAVGKPFYVAVESYKFARLFPLNQRDLMVESKAVAFDHPVPPGVTVENPSRDYCPPGLISLLFTDLGALTPAAVSDELIQLYQ